MPPLTVAVTGPTGTFGSGLIPLLEDDDRVGKVIGIARRPFVPSSKGWHKMEYRQGDVRDQEALEQAFHGADVVVHLAFNITGNASREALREINVEGTLHAFRAAKSAGAKRFVYASSIAAYGFHADNPIGITEDHPTRPAEHLFYAQEKAEIEQALANESLDGEGPDLYLLRPGIVVGPEALGAKDMLPGPLAPLGKGLLGLVGKIPVPLPTLMPPVPIQFVHHDDVGRAFLLCIHGEGPPGAYNLIGDGVLDADTIAGELGLAAIPVPEGIARSALKAVAQLPAGPPALAWAEAATHPTIVDATKAKTELGWTPRYSSLEALRDTLHAAG
jgi:nucleoside-diphosphate-sugar epimerase